MGINDMCPRRLGLHLGFTLEQLRPQGLSSATT